MREYYKKMPPINPIDIIRMGGILKEVEIPDQIGCGHVYSDLACSRLCLAALKFRRGKTKEGLEDMKIAHRFLKNGERYNPFERIVDEMPNPPQWSERIRDGFRFAIELYNSMAIEYRKQGINIMPLEIKDGRLVPMPSDEERRQYSLDSSMV